MSVIGLQLEESNSDNYRLLMFQHKIDAWKIIFATLFIILKCWLLVIWSPLKVENVSYEWTDFIRDCQSENRNALPVQNVKPGLFID